MEMQNSLSCLIFISISLNKNFKGGALLDMVNNFLGNQTFIKGLQVIIALEIN
jgi:hypothetical protein